ncbi:hypothetical protein PVAP13_9KG028512 [Panicum virgatum]|uniref:Uncharacterized protein n=1 Tax=Panicum virgatum TaxID=38727 RepID=A0A8T0N816_PANVG|nr:hypothetical protein PVAP13_9KG028512 [Panicum virgatum]
MQDKDCSRKAADDLSVALPDVTMGAKQVKVTSSGSPRRGPSWRPPAPRPSGCAGAGRRRGPAARRVRRGQRRQGLSLELARAKNACLNDAVADKDTALQSLGQEYEWEGHRGRRAGQPQALKELKSLLAATSTVDRPRAGPRLRSAPAERDAAVGVAAVDDGQAEDAQQPPEVLDWRAGQAEGRLLAVGADGEPDPQGTSVRVAQQHCQPQVRGRRGHGKLRR